jgi:hypothetical protein
MGELARWWRRRLRTPLRWVFQEDEAGYRDDMLGGFISTTLLIVVVVIAVIIGTIVWAIRKIL